METSLCLMPCWFPNTSKEAVMNTSPQRIFWWGVGFLVLGAIGIYADTSAGLQAALTQPANESIYFWLLSPGLRIIQSATFPLGAALIAASAIIHHITPQMNPQHTPDPNTPAYPHHGPAPHLDPGPVQRPEYLGVLYAAQTA